jgi:hypothetical protein
MVGWKENAYETGWGRIDEVEVVVVVVVEVIVAVVVDVDVGGG